VINIGVTVGSGIGVGVSVWVGRCVGASVAAGIAVGEGSLTFELQPASKILMRTIDELSDVERIAPTFALNQYIEPNLNLGQVR
jgi:hypothetical protein